ncbi:MAG TPA: fused MFS/spermidine synthase [Bryobacteraceae bacterium]|jgi:hypothetical protein|nr:fused MFS/spermidine synthase [Bryobacteraceae bacterium]
MTATTTRRVPTPLFGATILLSAFLLFQVQPLIAKLILPWFGGSAAVWTSCMLFFQIALLGGYTYAHWLSDQTGPRQTIIHAGLLAVSLLSLPILPSVWWKPDGPGDPLLRILGLLTATVGLPYFLLASTSPLLQSWYSRSNGGAMPYRFFALSNAGSMAGLLTYPILVEPNMTNRAQAWMWSIAYTTFAVVCVTVSFLSRHSRAAQPARSHENDGPPPVRSQKVLWMGLAATASALLLAVTNHVTQNIAPIPFLWVAPLGLYLLSFILCFDSDRWYNRTAFATLAAVALPVMAYAIVNGEDFSSLRVAITFFCAAIFVLFMVCHGELARRRPAPAYLTSFYLMVSLGGAFGGLLIGFAAPYLFNAVYDLPVIVTLTAFLFVYLLWTERIVLIPALATAAPLVAAVAAAWIGSYLAKDTWQSMNHSRVLMRNFYGSLQVYDSDTDGRQGPVRILRHGTIDHGEQFLRAENSRRPTTYFTGGSGIGLAIHSLQKDGPMRVGIIGLGAGSIAAYCRAGDNYLYYDINPQVLKVAAEQFTYLRDCPAQHDVILGDARLVIEQQPPQRFDLLVVDAFSGDAIPVHLLTREAWALYWKHLNPNGVLAVHVSNRYLRLAPVVALGAETDGKQARIVSYDGGDIDEEAASDWVLVTSRPGFFEQDGLRGHAEVIKPIPGLRPWTDDYSNVFKILR